MKDIIKNKLNETFSKSDREDISKQINTFIDSKEFEKKIEKIVLNRLKDNKELEDKVVDITKEVLINMYKALWVKRSTWMSAIK